MSTDDAIKIVAGLLVGLVGLTSLGINLYQYGVKRRRDSLAEIIQGEKETAAAAAVRIRDKNKQASRQELQALCLASVFERSGRTRTLIYAALLAQRARDPGKIREIVDQITVGIARNAAFTDLALARRRLISLRAVLALDGDSRTRIDAIEKYTRAASSDVDRPCSCTHEAHSWRELREPVGLLGRLILVCGTQRLDDPHQSDRVLKMPVIALDYHRTSAGDLSAQGRLLVDGKYGEDRPSRASAAGLKQFSSNLEVLIRNSRSFSTANAIAVVPGTEHQYSNELGNMLSRDAGLPLVSLRRTGANAFAVEGECEGRSLILVDDVYRSGRTLRDAASCLFNAGAREVLGLAVTCTVSGTELPCHDQGAAGHTNLSESRKRLERIQLAIEYLRTAEGAGKVPAEVARRAIEQLHAEHALWLVDGSASSSAP